MNISIKQLVGLAFERYGGVKKAACSYLFIVSCTGNLVPSFILVLSSRYVFVIDLLSTNEFWICFI